MNHNAKLAHALVLLPVLALVTLVGCGGEEEPERGNSSSLGERVLTVEDVPGSKPDPVEVRQTAAGLDQFSRIFADFSIAPDADEIAKVFEKAGFEGAVLDTRYVGETHSGGLPHVTGLVVQVESEDGATIALDFLEEDLKKPCPNSCAVTRTDFRVDAIPGARGVYSIASAEDIASVGTPDQKPFESYWVGFTDGTYASTVEMYGSPGSVSEEEAIEIAAAYHERVVGR